MESALQTFAKIRPESLLTGSAGSLQVDGGSYGAGSSFFLVDAKPGDGPDRHMHPYSEIWVVLEGEVRFTVGDVTENGRRGDIVVVVPNTPHSFKNCGTQNLRMVCIHDTPAIVNQPLPEPREQAA